MLIVGNTLTGRTEKAGSFATSPLAERATCPVARNVCALSLASAVKEQNLGGMNGKTIEQSAEGIEFLARKG